MTAAQWVALGAVVALAAGVRVLAAQDELWQDELWSLYALVVKTKTPAGILTAHHDNNHYLISLWMYLVMPVHNWVVYRIPSLVAGVATVALAAQFARRWGTPAMFAGALLTASSYILIFYASEARGYALSGAFALLGLLALDRYLAKPTLAANSVYCLATVLGTLSHLTYVQCFVGAVAWSAVEFYRREAAWQAAMVQLLKLHAVPLCFLVTLYFGDVRQIEYGGGDKYVLAEVLENAGALALGLADLGSATAIASGGIVLLAAAIALWLLERAGSTQWVYFLTAFVVTPILLFLVQPPRVLHERYFYLNILFFFVLLSFLAGRAWQANRAARGVALTLLALFVIANARLTYEFLQVGRGHFQDLLQYIADHDPQGEIHLSGDAHFAYTLHTNFYSGYLAPGHKFYVHKMEPEMTVDPEWVITNSQRKTWIPPDDLREEDGTIAYRFEKLFPYAGLSGAHFALYRRVHDNADARQP